MGIARARASCFVGIFDWSIANLLSVRNVCLPPDNPHDTHTLYRGAPSSSTTQIIRSSQSTKHPQQTVSRLNPSTSQKPGASNLNLLTNYIPRPQTARPGSALCRTSNVVVLLRESLGLLPALPPLRPPLRSTTSTRPMSDLVTFCNIDLACPTGRFLRLALGQGEITFKPRMSSLSPSSLTRSRRSKRPPLCDTSQHDPHEPYQLGSHPCRSRCVARHISDSLIGLCESHDARAFGLRHTETSRDPSFLVRASEDARDLLIFGNHFQFPISDFVRTIPDGS